ncbi:pyridoxal 5'-phosphate synthase glutaminase subunit PdxT [archaeon]
MAVGVLAVQGAVVEHLHAISSAGAKGVEVKTTEALESADALIIPGGESTTISRLISQFGLRDEIIKRAKSGMPVMGTCAGMIVLAKQGNEQVKKTGQELLGLMDTTVNRNAFGRQRESFEATLDVKPIGSFPGVFIRAPVIEHAEDGVEVLCEFENKIVAARQDNLLALSFHPELTSDTRMHEYFLGMI